MPSIEALVRYIHAVAGFPVKSTWLKSIKKWDFDSWPGLTYTNADKYCPHSVMTIKGHMVQSSQGVRSTKKNKHQSNNNQNKPTQGTLQKQSEAENIDTYTHLRKYIKTVSNVQRNLLIHPIVLLQ